jgi:hypothetical protein
MQNLHKDWTTARLLERNGLFVKRPGFSGILFLCWKISRPGS